MRTVGRRAAAAVARRVAVVAERLGAVPGVVVERAGDEVVVSGRGLAARVIADAELRHAIRESGR